MGIQDREWYQEAQRNNHQHGSQWNSNSRSQTNPLNKAILLYLSLSVNVMLGAALYYLAH